MINLLPDQGKRSIKSDYLRRILVVSLFLIAVAFLLGNVLLALLAWRLQVEADGLTKLREAEEKKGDRLTLVEAKKSLTEAKNRLNILNNLEAPGRAPADLFEEIVRSKTKGIKIISLGYSTSTSQAGVVTIAGSMDTRNNFLKWVEILKTNKSFSAIDSPVSNIIRDREGSFTLTLTVN